MGQTRIRHFAIAQIQRRQAGQPRQMGQTRICEAKAQTQIQGRQAR